MLTKLKTSCDVFMKTIWNPYWEAKEGGYKGESSRNNDIADCQITFK